MAQLSPQKRKKRRVQLREAQRRRRARLKEESKSFLQIILSQEMLLALRHYSDSVGKPLHACAAELIERGLDRPRQLDCQQQEGKQQAPVAKDVPPCNGAYPESGQTIPTLEKNEGGLGANQTDPSGG
ncbi:MAG: hypothetical protein JO279_08120 [Verrucomicrobia bacterium]|nr:hypothetical protein [Verrucomicrobiota bacterium]MBV8376957.1 hypothetical protein [Verrucomicrobiota bacterium]